MDIRKNKLVFVLVPLIIVAGLIAAVLIASGGVSEGASSSRTSPPSNSKNDQPTQTDSTVEGTYECLPHNGDGPQTLECGLGVRADDGTMYGLRFDDPHAVSSVPMGKRIRVTGAITEEATQYDTAGTIRVETFEQVGD